MWSYKKVDTDFGVLMGPMLFELNVSDAVDCRKGWGGNLAEVIITCSEDHAATVSLLKFHRPSDNLTIIKVSIEQDIGMKFCLDYDVSFDQAVEEMKNHMEHE